MISVVTWLWAATTPHRRFCTDYVNTECRMFARNLGVPHRFLCIADEPHGLDTRVEFIETPAAAREVGELRTPEGSRFPSCYRRLWMFSREARMLGDLVLLVDIDLILMRPIPDLLEPVANFVGWRPAIGWGASDRVAGGIYLLKTGMHTSVWESFRGVPSISAARREGYRGSDQAWISYQLGRDATIWPRNSGIYSIRDMKDGAAPLPPDARLVQFNGPTKPWDSKLPWVREHWR